MLNNKTHNRLKLQAKGVLAVAQWDWRCLCSTRMQVRSPAWHSELQDLVMPPLWRRSQLWLGFDLWPGNSICHHGVVKRKKQTKNWVRDLNRHGDTQTARKQRDTQHHQSLEVCKSNQNARYHLTPLGWLLSKRKSGEFPSWCSGNKSD